MLDITPVISSLKSYYPDAEIDLLIYQDTKTILDADPQINQFYLIKKNTDIVNTIRNFVAVRRELKKNHYDLIINLTEQWPIGLLIYSLQRHSIAFSREKRIFNQLLSTVTPSKGIHVVEQNLSILDRLGISESEKIQTLTLCHRDSDRESLNAISPGYGRQPYVVIQPTARQAFKCWDDEKFAPVIDHLMQKKLTVIMTCGPAASELQQVERIASLCKQRPNLAFAGKISFPQLSALLDRAVLYTSMDLAPIHMAAALNTPQVCLFGATSYQQWRPWSEKAILIWAGNYHTMPTRKNLDRSEKYLNWIPVQAVIDAVDKQLNQC